MSYTPNTWKSGDVVTSAKLNNIEQGIANAALLVTADENTGACDTKASVMYNAIANGQLVIIKIEGLGAFTVMAAVLREGYTFEIHNIDSYICFVAATGDDYPAAQG